ncbi:MAG: hypothetical protein AAGF55_09220 [Pseudomonadota bacterium]
MTLKSTTALVLAGVVLAGCGGGSSNTVSNSPAFGGIYEPNFRDGTNNEYDELASAEGLVYFIGNLDGTVSEVRVRIERNGAGAADDRLFVEINGAAAREFEPIMGETTDTGTELSGAWVASDGSQDEFSVSVDSNNNALFSSAFLRLNNAPVALGGFNRGFGGLETAVSDLPTSATYTGSIDLDTEGMPTPTSLTTVDAIDSTAAAMVDFAGGTITGTHTGTSFLGTGGSVNGDINGTVSGTRLTGTITVEDNATGTLDFGGSVLGAGAETIRGGAGGTVDFGGAQGSTTVGGGFLLIKD